ncbi:MAG: DUF6686 family protein [Nitrospiria bacterium]
MNKESEPIEVLAHSEIGKIERCKCRGYHLTFRNMVLNFHRKEFVSLVRLFRQASEKEDEDYLFSYVNRGDL